MLIYSENESLSSPHIEGISCYLLEVMKAHYPTQFSDTTLAGVHGGQGASLNTGESGRTGSLLSFVWHW